VCSSCQADSYLSTSLYSGLHSTRSREDDDRDEVDELFDRAKAAYRREQRGEQDRIRRNKDYAYDWVQTVIGWLLKIAEFFLQKWLGCYITTALVRRLGLPDDCHHLKVLRRFRDTYLLGSGDPQKLADVKRYYEIAPTVVEWVHSRRNADAIWEDLAETIAACVAAIDRQDFETAYRLYKGKVLDLRRFIQDGSVPA